MIMFFGAGNVASFAGEIMVRVGPFVVEVEEIVVDVLLGAGTRAHPASVLININIVKKHNDTVLFIHQLPGKLGHNREL